MYFTKPGIPTVTHLTFSNNFNCVIFRKISSSITHVTFGYHFNQSIADIIPDSVTHIVLGNNFTQPIKNIPVSVTYLTMGRLFVRSTDESDFTVTHLTLSGTRLRPFDIPAHIKSVIIYKLSFVNYFNSRENQIIDWLLKIFVYRYCNNRIG